MVDNDVRVPAGWYPDPLGLPQLRWWDNHSWTEHTSDARQPMVATETVIPRLAFADDDEDFADDRLYVIDDSLGDDALTRRERRERERLETETDAPIILQQGAAGTARVDSQPLFGDPLLSLEAPVREEITIDEPSPAERLAETTYVEDAPTSMPFLLDNRFDDLLGETAAETAMPRPAFSYVGESSAHFVPEDQFRADYERRQATHTSIPDFTPRATTGPVWVIALMPLLILVLGLLFLLSGMAGSASPIFIALIVVLPYLATVGLAIIDRQTLKRHGFQHTAHWAWSFLTAPVYLITRLASVVRETGRGFGPLLTWGAFGLLTVGSLVAVPGLVIAMSPSTFSTAAEQSIEQDAISLGANLKVECPAVPPQLIGSSFQCTAVDSGGEFFNVTVSLQRANGWIEWRVEDWGIMSMAN
ncbi:MAG TPA: DUF2510 domain-containing protein [Pseudolysinimonas sp.]|nr:DUF2510 domain-containing protein [Pseudolysinimonas sp.]